MKSKVLIACTGHAGSGKTSVARSLALNFEQHYGASWTILSFAKPLKAIDEEIFGAPADKMNGGRQRLQYLSGARKFDLDVWVRHLAKALVDAAEKYDVVLVDDCRFLNEAEFLRLYGFMLVRVVGRGYPLEAGAAAHESEKEQDMIVVDFVAENDGDLDDTTANVFRAYMRWRGRERA